MEQKTILEGLGIRCKSKNENLPALSDNAEIFLVGSNKLLGVSAIDISLRPGELVTAKAEIEVEEVDLENIIIQELNIRELSTGKRYKLVEIEEDEDGNI